MNGSGRFNCSLNGGMTGWDRDAGRIRRGVLVAPLDGGGGGGAWEGGGCDVTCAVGWAGRYWRGSFGPGIIWPGRG